MRYHFYFRQTFTLLLALFIISRVHAVTYVSNVAAGNWATAASWSPAGIPVAGDNVTILSGHVITVAAAASVTNVTINTGGTLRATSALTVSAGGIFTIQAGGLYRHGNTTLASTSIFNGTESFDPASTVQIDSWSATADRLATGVTLPFGNVTSNYAAVWDQAGTLGGATQRIMGTLTVTAGQFDFDDGGGATTQLITGPIVTSGTAGIVFAQGANRNLTLTTGSFTHNGSSLSAVMYQSYGVLNWTINGTFAVSKDFTLIQGPGAAPNVAASATVTTTGGGNFNISGGFFDLNRGYLNGNLNLVVSGGITISGAPSWMRFMDYNVIGNLNVSAASMTVSGGAADFLFLVNGTANTATYNITGNMSVSGATTNLYLMGGDDGGFPFASVMDPRGTLSLTVGCTLSQSAGNFRGIQNTASTNAGILTMNIGSVNFTGGTFLGSYGCNTTGGTHIFNVTGNASISFAAAADLFAISRLATLGGVPNTCGLNMTIGGNLSILGAGSGDFNSCNGSGAETNVISGNVSISQGDNFFNSVVTAGNGHTTTTTIAGTLTVSGGITQLSSETGTFTGTVTGAVLISGGTLIVKESTGAATLNFNSTYTQTAGSFILHDNTTANNNIVAVTVAGDFSLGAGATAGIINFDKSTTSTSTNTLTLNGSSYIMGGTSQITHASAGTGTVFGMIYFNPTGGTVTYNKQTAAASTTQGVQQVKQTINAAKIVDATGTTSPFQIASNSTQANITTTALTIDGTLNMGAKFISAQGPSLTNYYSGFNVSATGRLQTSNLNGFYNGTNASATVEPQVFSGNATFRMDWSLNATSTIEYNGNGNQVVTGKFPSAGALADVATGSTSQYKYGNLDINNSGTPGTNYDYPAVPAAGTGNVFVRTTLVLTAGELSLAGSGTGQTITVENSAVSGITRNTGYIKSEEANAGNNRAIVQWNCGATNGAFLVPFGLSNTYIPFTFTKTAGNSNMQFSTRATAANDNLPWAAVSSVAAVSNMNSATLGGANGSIPSTIDRWWNITAVSGPATVTADLLFTYRGVENTTTLAPTGMFAAQHWNGTYWDDQVGSGTGVIAGTGTVSVSGANTFSPWVLTSVNAPLPIELLTFQAHLDVDKVDLKWTTATETNNDFFTVEKSRDGQNFETLMDVKGAGNSTVLIDYFDVDATPFHGISYYRLKQTDFDGKYTFSNIVPVEYQTSGNSDISIFPNPGTEGSTTYLSLNDFNNEEILVVLRDIAGRELYSKVVVVSSSDEIIAVDKDGKLAKGSYLVTASSKNKLYSKRLIIK